MTKEDWNYVKAFSYVICFFLALSALCVLSIIAFS